MNEMEVEPLGLDDRLPCVVYLPPSLCLGLGTTVRTLLTALAQRRRWVEEGKLRGDLIQVPPDPAEKLAKILGELAKKDAEIERLRAALEMMEAEAAAASLYCSICGSCGEEGCGCTHKCVYAFDHPDVSERLAKLEAVAEAARDALAFLKGIEGSGYGGTSEYDVLVVNFGHGLAALDEEKADG